MQIEVRATQRLRGEKPVDIAPVLSSLARAAQTSTVDLSQLRVVLDWVQYRQNFREAVTVRRIMPSALQTATHARGETNGAESYEIAIDLRRAGAAELDERIRRAMGLAEDAGRQYLEGWLPGRESCIWAFNALYWNALGLWEEATGREYEQALPGGETDARNVEAAREIILDLFRVWDGLAARRALPEDLHVLELGVGNGNQAKVWLDEFLRLDRERGGEYYRRLHYLMGDYSPHVLARARENVAGHASRVSALVLDATTPTTTLAFLRDKAFLIYISNVYDNLPTDEIVRIGGQIFRVEARAYLTGATAGRIAESIGVDRAELPELVNQLLQLGPELLSRARPQQFAAGPLAAVTFWQEVWEGLRLDERYVHLEGLDTYDVAPGINGEILRPVVEANGDIRMQVSNGAAASFVDSLPLLHPFGSLLCHDLFVTDVDQYQSSFRGPGKYDGSVVNWVNGPVMTTIANRRGFEAKMGPFLHRPGSNITTFSARVRE
jgi:hypothetical protein